METLRRSRYTHSGTRKRSRSGSLRDGANTRWNACSSITWKTLRRTRIYLGVGQRSKTTVDQAKEERLKQNGKFRTSCCPWIVVKFCYWFVLHIATAGLAKYIFKSSIRAKSEEPAPGNWRDSPKTPNANLKKDINRASDDRLRDLPEWSEEFTEISKIQKCLHPHTFRMTQIRKVLQEWNSGSTVLKLTSRRTKDCEICKRTDITRAPYRRRTGEAVPRAEKFGDLITADHKVPQRGRRISKQSPIRSRGTRSCLSLDSILSVQNKNFSQKNGKECTKVSRAV